MDSLLDIELMTTSLVLSMITKLFFFLFAVVAVHLLLGWMDKRSGGGFNAWRTAVMETASPRGMISLGHYYCIRFAALYIWAALLFSS